MTMMINQLFPEGGVAVAVILDCMYVCTYVYMYVIPQKTAGPG